MTGPAQPQTVPVPPELAARLDALQRAADALPVAILDLRLRAQRLLARGEGVDLAALDDAVAACGALAERLEGGGR